MYKIVLEYGKNGNKIEGVSGLSYAECKRRIDNYLAQYADIAAKERFIFHIVGVDE